MDTFERDLQTALDDMRDARASFVSLLQSLADADLERARRGGWPVRRVLEHVLQSEHLYTTLVQHLRGLPVTPREPVSREGQAVDQVLCELESGHSALLSAVEGVDEETFYRLGRLGHEEYSVLSVLENVALHDREHVEQIAAILAATR